MKPWAREQSRLLALVATPVRPVAALVRPAILGLCGDSDPCGAVLAILTIPLRAVALFVAPLFSLFGVTCAALTLRARDGRDRRDVLAAGGNAVDVLLSLALWFVDPAGVAVSPGPTRQQGRCPVGRAAWYDPFRDGHDEDTTRLSGAPPGTSLLGLVVRGRHCAALAAA